MGSNQEVSLENANGDIKQDKWEAASTETWEYQWDYLGGGISLQKIRIISKESLGFDSFLTSSQQPDLIRAYERRKFHIGSLNRKVTSIKTKG